MKYTKKQQRIIDYLTKLGDKTRLNEYKARLAKRDADKKAARAAKKKAVQGAMAGIKVGDLFAASWGYDQTNVDFFQVVALVGKNSVRVRQVVPTMVDEKPGMMYADRTYEIPKNGEMLPATTHSVFIKDNVKGDVKRIQIYAAKDTPYFKLSSFAWAYKQFGDTAKHYESWYA